VQAKPFKQKERLEACELGVLIYGRNMTNADGSIKVVVKEALKCARSQLAEQKNLRTRQSVTDEEIEMLEDKYLGKDMPENDGKTWIYTGFCYQNENSAHNERCENHPNREFLIKRYLDEINNKLSQFNEEVQNEWKADKELYE